MAKRFDPTQFDHLFPSEAPLHADPARAAAFFRKPHAPEAKEEPDALK